MKKVLFACVLALPFYSMAYLPVAMATYPEDADTATEKTIFKGTIENLKDYKPLPDVLLTITSMDGKMKKSATTDNSGKFFLADVPAGNYSLCFEKPGFERGVCQSLILKPGKVNTFGFFMYED
jgi:hypothetical protein